MNMNDAERLLNSVSAERLKSVFNKPIKPILVKNDGPENHNPLDDEEDFINEHGEFSAKLKLYDDEEGAASLAYYGLAGEVVRTIYPHSEADPAATLITFLTAFGNIIGDNAHFKAGAREHPVRLFAALVGATGKGRKGTSISPVRLLFKAIEPEWEKEHIKKGLSSGEGLIQAVRDAEYRKEPVFDGKGKDKKIIGYNTVCVDEGVEDKRAFVVEEEFGKVLRAANREGNTLSAIIRELWDTGEPNVLTKNPIKVTGAHISILGHITVEELQKEMSKVDTVNGFANRFLWLMVERSKFLPSGGQFHKIDVQPLVEKINAAVEFSREAGEITRDEEAEQLWHDIYEELSTGAGGIVGAATSRAEAQTMRLACAYALLDCSNKITVTHLQAALDLWSYCFKSARFIFGNGTVLSQPKAIQLLEELKRRKENGLSGMTRNEVRNFFNRNISKSELDIIVKDLNSNGYVRVDKIKTPGAKKPTQKIVLLE